MHRRTIAIATAIFILLFSASLCTGAEKIILLVNGKEISTDVSPQMSDGRVLVPVRFVSESLGANVSWDENSSSVSIEWNDKMKALLTLGYFMDTNQEFANEVMALVDKYFKDQKAEGGQ